MCESSASCCEEFIGYPCAGHDFAEWPALLDVVSTLGVGVVLAEEEDERGKLASAVWEGGVTRFGLNTWKALTLAPGLFNEEKGRAEDGEVRGEDRGANPPTSETIMSGEFPSALVMPCDWFHPENAGCGDTTAGGGVSTLPFISMGGAILTGDRIALGRGRLPALFTEETSCTGPFPTSLLVSPVSMASSSDPLDRSLPDSPESLLLEELDVLDVEEERELFWPRPLPVSGIKGGICGAEMAATCTLPTLEMWREEEEEEGREGGWVLVSAGIGLLRGLLAAEGARGVVETVETVRVVRVEGGATDSVVEMEVMG